MFTSQFLSNMRNKALRRGVWFKALDNIERNILSLTTRVVNKVESVILGIELVKILVKIRDALKGKFVRRMEEYGLLRVKKLAVWAIEWGYISASGWIVEFDFVRYVTMLDINAPSGWGF